MVESRILHKYRHCFREDFDSGPSSSVQMNITALRNILETASVNGQVWGDTHLQRHCGSVKGHLINVSYIYIANVSNCQLLWGIQTVSKTT